MKHLPVPALQQSLDRYLAAIQPLSGAEQRRRTSAVVEEFATSDGPACQAELERWASAENAAGRSWLSRAWLAEYLRNRDPLPLSSNVAFRLRWHGGETGIARAVDVIHRAAAVHLAHLRGEIGAQVNARGEALDMTQWRVLAGGLRHPRPGMDVFVDGGPDAGTREIVVLWHGAPVMMPISDASGHPLARPVLASALRRLVGLQLPDDGTFTHPSYLGSEQASAHLTALLEDPANAAVHERVTQALFAVNLGDTPGDEESHQERVSFLPGQAWARKPLTYQVSLVDDHVGVHAEHSMIDGTTLKSMVALMQEVEPLDTDGAPLPLTPLTWVMGDEQRVRLADDIVAYRHRAESHRVRILSFPMPAPPPFRVSHDALLQFALLHAQLVGYGRVRSTYEAVDMREYQAGRTECLRPNTAAALALVEALVEEVATPEHLHAALAAHREQIISCKSGQGFNRHLLGLRLAARHLGLGTALFDDESYRRLTTDFLSTSSVGDADTIVRFTFAPTSVGGIGVNYCATDSTYEYCLVHDSDTNAGIEDFIDALGAGVAALARLVAKAGAALPTGAGPTPT